MTRPRTPAVAAAVALALAGVLALTSHASVWAVPRRGQADLVELAATVLAVLAICFGGAALVALRGGGDRRSAFRRAMPAAVVASSLLGLGAISTLDLYPVVAPAGVQADDEEGRRGIRLRSDWRGPAIRRGGEGGAEAGGGLLRSDWQSFVRRMLAFAALLGVVVLVALRRATRGESLRGISLEAPGRDAAARAAAHGAVERSIDAMLDDPDPRTAIIGAYARLQEELEVTGASRHDYEGPFEHLHRVLSVLRVRPAPLRTLIGLFEEARFSEHPLAPRHRDAALEALRAVAVDLAPEAGRGTGGAHEVARAGAAGHADATR